MLPNPIPGGQSRGEQQIYQEQGGPTYNYMRMVGSSSAPMTEQEEQGTNHQYTQATNQEQQAYTHTGQAYPQPMPTHYIQPQIHTTSPFNPQQEQLTYQHQQITPTIAPLSTNFHPQTYIPQHGYSSYFPPEQKTNNDRERITQLERLLGISLSRQQSQVGDNKNLKGKTEQEMAEGKNSPEYDMIDSEMAASEEEDCIKSKGGKKGDKINAQTKRGFKGYRDLKSPNRDKRLQHQTTSEEDGNDKPEITPENKGGNQKARLDQLLKAIHYYNNEETTPATEKDKYKDNADNRNSKNQLESKTAGKRIRLTLEGEERDRQTERTTKQAKGSNSRSKGGQQYPERHSDQQEEERPRKPPGRNYSPRSEDSISQRIHSTKKKNTYNKERHHHRQGSQLSIS